ncbi:hypothetical protein BGW42_001149 [Actinomortierella wolfii]|nr:hypothetical protein BGW42_001149 [Actinomortierella wolfii]
MRALSTIAFTTLVASVVRARCEGINFDIIHYNPPSFTSGEELHATYYGQVTRKVDRDVNLHTTFMDKNRKIIHKDVSNWCATLERYGGHCPMEVEDGFKLTFKHKFNTKVDDHIIIAVQAFGNRNACYAYNEDEIQVA